MNNKYRPLLLFQMILIVFGTLLSGYNLISIVSENSGIWSVISAIIYFLSHVTLVVYTYSIFKVQSDRYFRPTIYAYLALLGLQIIQSGNFITGYGLSLDLTFFINVINLIAFASIIRFMYTLEHRKTAFRYIAISVLCKLTAEVILVYLLRDSIQLYQILMALSVPIYGISVAIAWLSRS